MASKKWSTPKCDGSHDEVMARRLSNDADFAAEYLKAALEDENELGVVLIALRHLALAQTLSRRARR
jgi:DNA-binding phage protein